MEIIASGRRTGKTSRLIKLCAEAEERGEIAYIVTFDHAAARAIVDKARAMGVVIRYPMTYEEMKTGYGYKRQRLSLFIDNAEVLLKRMANGANILAVTFNVED